MHRQRAPTRETTDLSAIDFTTTRLTCDYASDESQEIVANARPAGRVMVCLTRARLHTTKRRLAKSGGARWWCVGRRHPATQRWSTSLDRDSRHHESHLFCTISIG